MIKNRFVLIDAFALIFRAYHALPPLSYRGENLNAVYGFTSALLSSIKNLEPEYLAVGFDLPTKTVRHEQYKEYKAHRVETPPDLMAQVPYVREVLKAFNIPIFDKEGYEGEDVIASIIAITKNLELRTKNLEKDPLSSKISDLSSDMDFIIVTGDLDCLQLVDEQTKVYSMARGVNQAVMYDIEKVRERYGLDPSQFVDFKALKGDASDNIPGVPGIGEKTATNLIKQYESLEKLYQEILNPKSQILNKSQITNSKLQKKQENIKKISGKLQTLLKDNKDQAFLSQKLSKIVDNLEIDFELSQAKIHDYDYKKVVKLLNELGFKSLVSRLPEVHKPEAQPKLL